MAKTNEDSMLFPQKLMEILAEPDNQKAISWLPSGKAFVVHDRDAFAESVMPKYFSRQAKYSSFTRKLNRWYVAFISLLSACDQSHSSSRVHFKKQELCAGFKGTRIGRILSSFLPT